MKSFESCVQIQESFVPRTLVDFRLKKNDLFAGTLIKSSLKPAGDRIYPLHLPFTAHKIHKGWSYPIANAKCVSRCTGRKRVSMYFASR